MIKKILPLIFILVVTVFASIVDTANQQRDYYMPEEDDNLVIEYYCLDTNEILVTFGENEMNVVWTNKKTGKLENLKCDDFKEWAKSEDILKDLDMTAKANNGKE